MCKKQSADLVLLVDQSESIVRRDYDTMKTFMSSLVGSFPVSPDLVRVGVAQFSDDQQKEFYLNEYTTLAEVTRHIMAMVQGGGGTKMGGALRLIKEFFHASTGSRAGAGVSQNLVLMTDGRSDDRVEQAAAVLRGMAVEMFVIGVGSDVEEKDLKKITPESNRIFTVTDFNSLASIKEKVVTAICTSEPPGESAGS